VRRSALVRAFETATGTAASERIGATLERFGPYLGGMIVAKGLSTLGQLLLGRCLGPSELGHLAVVLATSTLLASPIAGAWGGALVRYGAGTPEATWAPLVRATRRRALLWTAMPALVVLLLSPLLAPWFAAPPALLASGAGLALAMALWLFTKAACQGRENWQRFVAAEVGFGAGLALPAAALLWSSDADWRVAATVVLAAYLLGSAPGWALFQRAARVCASDRASTAPPLPTRVVEYTRLAILVAAANTAFVQGDRFAVQRILGFAEVGVYQVYNLATLGVALLISTLLYNFAFPLFVQGEPRAFAALFRAAFTRLLPVTLLLLFGAGAAQIYLSGFPFRPGLLALATLSATAAIAAGYYGHLVASLGVAGVRLGTRVSAATLAAFAAGVVPAARLGGLGGVFALYTAIFVTVAVFYDRALQWQQPSR